MNWRSNTPSQQLSPGRRSAFSHFLAVMALLIVSVADTTGTATLFKCVDSQGKVIFTDSPHQLLACHALEFSPTLQSSAASPARASALSPSKQGSEATESELTSPMSRDSEIAAVPVERLGNILVVSATLNGSSRLA